MEINYNIVMLYKSVQNVIEIEFLGTESIIPNKDLANDREVRDQEVRSSVRMRESDIGKYLIM